MTPPLNVTLVMDVAGLSKVEQFLKTREVFCLDLETNVTETFYDRRIRTIQIGDREEQIVIDLLGFAGSLEALYDAQGHYGANARGVFGPIIDVLRPYLEDHSITKAGHNLEFEYTCLRWCLGIRTDGFFDTLLAEKLIYAGLVHYNVSGFWGLSDLAARYCGLDMSKDLQKSFWTAEPLTEEQLVYAALDVRIPLAIRAAQSAQMDKNGLTRSFQIDCDAIMAFADMHMRGLLVDREQWGAILDVTRDRRNRLFKRLDDYFAPIVGTKEVTEAERARLAELENIWRDCPSKTPEDKARRATARVDFMTLRKNISDREKLAASCAGNSLINYGSPKQLLEAFRKAGYGVRKLPDTSDKTLEKLAKYRNLDIDTAFEKDPDLNYPPIDLLRLLRSVDKQISTYGKAWISSGEYIDEKGKKQAGNIHLSTGRIHSNFNVVGAATGRTSSSSPAVQNLDSVFRNCFVATPGFSIITADYSSCEPRLLAEMSQEPSWLNIFRNGWDLYCSNAEMVLPEEWAAAALPDCKFASAREQCECPKHKTLRKRLKIIVLSLCYGKGIYSLADEMGISVDEAKVLLAKFKAKIPKAIALLDKLGMGAVSELTSRTISGRWRRWKRVTWELAKELASADIKVPKGAPPAVASQEAVRKKYAALFASIDREGRNHPFQGGNGEITKRAMYRIWKRLESDFGGFFLNMVHDELVVECPDDVKDACAQFVKEEMEAAGQEFVKSVPTPVEKHVEKYWCK